jgi:hypothetical protein
VVPGMSHEKCIWKESRARRDRLAATSMSAAGRPGERNQTSGTNPDALTRSVHGPKLVSVCACRAVISRTISAYPDPGREVGRPDRCRLFGATDEFLVTVWRSISLDRFADGQLG